MLFLLGLPFFFVALADPYTALVSREVSFPGRRIGLMIDASTSMRTPFTAATLNKRAATDATFFTTVAAAERFVQLRMKGEYRDLLALVEFGNEAYVVTPFTNDYDNILLSISLIGDPVEFSMFPDQGTIIAQAIDESVGAVQGVQLPRRVRQPDGDLHRRRGHARDDRRPDARRDRRRRRSTPRFPCISCGPTTTGTKGKVIPDELWIPAVEKTGGKFYAADSEESLLAAIADIDRVSAGTIAGDGSTRASSRGSRSSR